LLWIIFRQRATNNARPGANQIDHHVGEFKDREFSRITNVHRAIRPSTVVALTRGAMDQLSKSFPAGLALPSTLKDFICVPSPGFCLLAYASGHRTFGEAAGWRRQAVALRATLEQSYAHPLGGFLEDRAGRLPPWRSPAAALEQLGIAEGRCGKRSPTRGSVRSGQPMGG
jgi:hypothetical protein